MKNILFAAIFFSTLPFQVSALEMEISGNLGNLSSINKQITLYNFGDSLLKAAESCAPYSEDFAKNNPQMASLAELFGGNDWKILIDIKGYNQDNLCRVTVRQNAGEFTLSEYDCLISGEQLAELHKAMLDCSTQPVTETFTSYAEISDGNGNFQKSPIETTMTDSLFNITWAKISSAACTISHKEPDASSRKNFLENYNKFSDSFIENLQNCRPAEETKSMLFMSESVTIQGKEDGHCKIGYSPFELKLPDEKLKEITSLEQIRTLAADTAYSRYIPEYINDGLLFMLDRCTRRQTPTPYQGTSQTKSNEFIQIRQNLASEYKDGECTVIFGNKLTVDNIEKDYSRTYILKTEYIASLLQPYQQLLKQTKEKTEKNPDGSYSFQSEISNDATQTADKALQENLFKSNLCSANRQTKQPDEFF